MQSLLGIQQNKKDDHDDDDENTIDVNQIEEEEEPHPLRTRLWEFQVHWRGPAAKAHLKGCSSLYDCTRLVLEFDPLGYVRLGHNPHHPDDHDNNNSWMATGTWSVEATGGVSCSIPIPVAASTITSSSLGGAPQQQQMLLLQHRFEADLHLNPFGTHAKLTRGVILRDRPKQRRRDVVGTFSGRGSGGPDTVDLSYATRRAPAPRS